MNRKINWRDGNGEFIDFSVVGVFICFLFLIFISVIEYSSATNTINQALDATARCVAISDTEKNAKKNATKLAVNSIKSRYIYDKSAKVTIKPVKKSKTGKTIWENGKYMIVTVTAQIKTLNPFYTSGRYGKSMVIALEGAQTSPLAVRVVRNIIYAVEEGGQQYGNAHYDAFEGVHANTASEVYVTIGAGGWYGIEGKQVLQWIYKKFGNVNGNLSHIINSWGSVQYGAMEAQVKSVLNSPQGRQGSDQFMDYQIKKYMKLAQQYGITNTQAQMMWVPAYHQRPVSAIKIAKANKGANLDQMYHAILAEPIIGKYKKRYDITYNAIKVHYNNVQ